MVQHFAAYPEQHGPHGDGDDNTDTYFEHEGYFLLMRVWRILRVPQ
jgi:hypothetical protein